MCRWMASLKAKNIILISRSGMKSQSALCMASELQQAGVQLKAYACDVSDFEQLDQTLGLCAKEMPPIRGVIQAAMVLRVSPQPLVSYYLSKATLGKKIEREPHLTITGHHHRQDDPFRISTSHTAQSRRHP